MSATQLPRIDTDESPVAVQTNGQTGESAGPTLADTEVKVAPRHTWYAPLKIAVEYFAALLLLIVAIPLILIAALLIKLMSRGPVFYLQTRLGKAGRTFKVIKLRTMVHNAEAKTGAVWSDSNDPRITAIGRCLRDTHIDEFPQLINVLLGQMSLIGPRPERPEIVDQLEWQISNYRERLQVRPGITGLAQLNLPPDSTIDSVRRKLLHDLYYVHYHSPWLDLRILCGTGWLLTRTLFRYAWNLIALPTIEKVCDRLDPIVGQQPDRLAVARKGGDGLSSGAEITESL